MNTSMVGRSAPSPAGDPQSRSESSFALVESKLHSPPARPGIVARTELVDRLLATAAPVVCVVAPAGYGKTTLLAQWADNTAGAVGREPATAGRLGSADHRDNDLHQRPDLGDLPRQAAELRTSLTSDPGAMHGASSLTTASYDSCRCCPPTSP
jgi:hypothetical protein